MKKTAMAGMLTLMLWQATAQMQAEPVSYFTDAIAPVRRGESFTASVHFVIRTPWYLYAPTGINADQGVIESSVTWLLPADIVRDGRPRLPATHFKNGFEVMSGSDEVITQKFRTLQSARVGTYQIKGRIVWQSCSDQLCLPPVADEIVLNITVE